MSQDKLSPQMIEFISDKINMVKRIHNITARTPNAREILGKLVGPRMDGWGREAMSLGIQVLK